MKILDNIGKIFKADTADLINWEANTDDYVFSILNFDKRHFLMVFDSSAAVTILQTQNGKVLHKVQLEANMAFFAEKNSEENTVIIGTDKGLFKMDVSTFEVDYFLKNNNWFEKGTWGNNYFLTSSGKTLWVYELIDQALVLIKKDDSFNSTISGIVFNKGSFLVSNYGEIRAYEINDGFETFESYPWQTSLLALAWSPNKRYISSGTQEKSVHFWEYPFEQDADFEISGFNRKITQICWSDDSKLLALNSDDDVHIWSFKNGPPINASPQTLRGGLGNITKIYFKKELLLAASKEGFIIAFTPRLRSKLINIKSVDGEITEMTTDDREETLFVGTAEGKVFSFDIDI